MSWQQALDTDRGAYASQRLVTGAVEGTRNIQLGAVGGTSCAGEFDHAWNVAPNSGFLRLRVSGATMRFGSMYGSRRRGGEEIGRDGTSEGFPHLGISCVCGVIATARAIADQARGFTPRVCSDDLIAALVEKRGGL